MKRLGPELTSLTFRIIDAIVAAPIEDEKKLLALEDIKQMWIDPDYDCKYINIHDDNNCLTVHHCWADSRLGESFWYKMHLIVGYV